jgi:hypothetical protein
MKTYLVTYAQNASPVNPKFFASMQNFCKANRAELIVVPGRYKNPTSRWSQQQETDDWWAAEITPYLATSRRSLCKNLKIFSDISIQPTANRPLTGFEGFLGKCSGIFGHAKRTLQVVATASRSPRIMWTTGACTVPNYTPSKAGKKGEHHHVIGALVVEVDKDACYFARHVTANKDGSFTDLDKVYTPNGVKNAPPAMSLVLGDWHAGHEDFEALDATKALIDAVRPQHIVLHDVLDFGSRSHHKKSSRHRFEGRFDSVEQEVRNACDALKLVSGWGKHTTHVVRSNHDEHFERWLEEHKDSEDPLNAPYWHEMKSRDLRSRTSAGKWLNLFEAEARRHKVPETVKFLKRNDSLRLLDVEHGFHGDKGPNGSRGTFIGYTRLGVKVSIGHSHQPGMLDGACQAGVTAVVDHGYNDLPGGWVQAHIHLAADGKRQIVVLVKGRYRGGMQ